MTQKTQPSVIKRDGTTESFDIRKIIGAATKCYKSIKKPLPESILKAIQTTFLHPKKDAMTVDDIQDSLYRIIRHDSRAAGKAFKGYRQERDKARDLGINGNYYNAVKTILSGGQNEVTRENTNKDAAVLNTMRDLIAGETYKKIYKDFYLNQEFVELDKKGVIHIHDKDYRVAPMTNCSLPNFFDMLDNGTVMNGKRIESPHSLRTAATIVTQLILGITNLQYGGVTIPISCLAPYLRKSVHRYKAFLEKHLSDIPCGVKDGMLKDMVNREVHDAIQTVMYQINSMTGSNGQAPFCTIFCYENELPEYKEETKTLIKELLKQRIKGMYSPEGYNINPAFPKIVYTLTEENIKPGNELTRLAAECTARRMVPDYVSEKKLKEYKDGLVFGPMGCRSFLSVWKNPDTGKKEIYGRGNIGVISINLPYLALESNTWKEFLQRVSDMVDKISSLHKKTYDSIAKSNVDVAPLLWMYGALGRAKSGTKIGKLIKDRRFTASIGYAGVAESVYRFGVDFTTKKGHTKGLELMKVLDARARYNADKYNIGISVYGTPLENTTGVFAKALKVFPTIKNVNDHDFVTNSYHYPVWEPVSWKDKIDFEKDLQSYSLGGAISYVEVDSIRKNPMVAYDILRKIYDDMMYCEINTKDCSVCRNCGAEGTVTIHHDGTMECTACGCKDEKKLYVLRRVCGYLGVVTNTNTPAGRIQDIVNRVIHTCIKTIHKN